MAQAEVTPRRLLPDDEVYRQVFEAEVSYTFVVISCEWSLFRVLFTAVYPHLDKGEICYFFRHYKRPIYEAKSLINIQHIFADCRVAVTSYLT